MTTLSMGTETTKRTRSITRTRVKPVSASRAWDGGGAPGADGRRWELTCSLPWPAGLSAAPPSRPLLPSPSRGDWSSVLVELSAKLRSPSFGGAGVLEFGFPLPSPRRNETSHKHSWRPWALNASTQPAFCPRGTTPPLCSRAPVPSARRSPGAQFLKRWEGVELPPRDASFAPLFCAGFSRAGSRREGDCDDLGISHPKMGFKRICSEPLKKEKRKKKKKLPPHSNLRLASCVHPPGDCSRPGTAWLLLAGPRSAVGPSPPLRAPRASAGLRFRAGRRFPPAASGPRRTCRGRRPRERSAPGRQRTPPRLPRGSGGRPRTLALPS